MKLRILLFAVLSALCLTFLSTAVMAQGEIPEPYAGQENPFPWDDASAGQAGKEIYQRSCLGCHGADGANLAAADFSALDFSENLQAGPDYYFWVLSDGRLSQGMPPFKASLSDDQRWQLLTHLATFAGAAAGATPTLISEPSVTASDALLTLSVPAEIVAGQPLTVRARLQETSGKYIQDATVKFFIRADYFISGLVEIGEAVTDKDGRATLDYTPRLVAETQITASYQSIEATAAITITESEEPLYQAHAGLPGPQGRDLIFIGPASALDLGEDSSAPMPALRIPGGLQPLLLLAYVAAIILVWGLYTRVWYQMYSIPVVKDIKGIDPRLIPGAAILIMVVTVIFLVLIVIIGPYSHLHLFR